MPSFRSNKFHLTRVQATTKDKEEEELFFAAGEATNADDDDDEVADDGKSWPIKPTPPPEPPQQLKPEPPKFVTPPKPVISESRLASDDPSMGVNLDKVVANLDPLLNPTIAKAVPSQTIQGAGIGGVLLTLLTSFFVFGPFSVSSLSTLITALSVGIITAYISITEGAAGDFTRSAGKVTKQLTDTLGENVEGWQVEKEVDKIANALLAPPPSPPEKAMPAPLQKGEETPSNEGKMAEVAEEASEPAPLDISVDYDAAARLAFEASPDAGDDFEEYKEWYYALTSAAVGLKHKKSMAADEAAAAAAEEKARVAAEKKAAEEAEAAAEQMRLEEEIAEMALRTRMRAEEEARAAEKARLQAEEEARAAEKARLQAEEDARWKAEEEAIARARVAAAEEAARRKAEEDASRARAEEELRLREEEEAREMAEAEEARRLADEAAAARKAAEAEEARMMEEQAAAAREAVRLMEEQEALMDDDEVDDEEDSLSDEDWEASVRLANELQGVTPPIEGDVMDAIGDEMLQMEIDDLSAEEEDALGKAAREAVRKYEQEMAMKSSQNEASAPRSSWDEEIVTPPPVVEEEAEETAPPAAEVDYSKMTVVQLKDLLRSKGLKVSGKKAVLIERLME